MIEKYPYVVLCYIQFHRDDAASRPLMPYYQWAMNPQ